MAGPGATATEPAAPIKAYDINRDVVETLITQEQALQRIQELAKQVAADYATLAPVIAPILKGGFIVAADFVRSLDPCPEGTTVEFIHARSYGARTETSGTVEVRFDEDAMRGRHVLLVDDLIDSGLTLLTVKQKLEQAGVASVKSLVLMDKKARRSVDYCADYVGFDLPNKWVVGFGMDTNQLYRSLNYVGVLHPDAAKAAVNRG